MATKLDLLKLFSTGQGVSGGLSNYINYPSDHDSNYTAIETGVNTLIDEIATARLTDSQLPRDLIVSSDYEANNSGNGRLAPWEARTTYTGANLTVTDGRIYVNGQRVDVQTQVFSAASLADDLYYIATDVNGLLTVSDTQGSSFFDIASVTVASNAWTTPDDDLLSTGNGRIPLVSADTTNLITHRTDFDGTSLVGNGAPSIRLVGDDGTLEDAGFAHDGTPSQFKRMSQRAISEGNGNTTAAEVYTPMGQNKQLEQGRVQLTRIASQAITTGTATGIQFDTLPTANVAGDPERFEPETYTASTDWQSGTGNVDVVIPSLSDLDGTWAFTATVRMNLDNTTATFLDVTLVQTVGGTAELARARVQPSGTAPTVVSISGEYDLVNGDEFQLQVEHDHGSDRNMTDARLTARLVGGEV